MLLVAGNGAFYGGDPTGTAREWRQHAQGTRVRAACPIDAGMVDASSHSCPGAAAKSGPRPLRIRAGYPSAGTWHHG